MGEWVIICHLPFLDVPELACEWWWWWWVHCPHCHCRDGGGEPPAPAAVIIMVVVVGMLAPLPSSWWWWWVHCPCCCCCCGGGGGCAAPTPVMVVVWQGALLCLVEFQTPMIFDCGCYFNYSTFYRLPKIVKIIIYTCQVNTNVLLILHS